MLGIPISLVQGIFSNQAMLGSVQTEADGLLEFLAGQAPSTAKVNIQVYEFGVHGSTQCEFCTHQGAQRLCSDISFRILFFGISCPQMCAHHSVCVGIETCAEASGCAMICSYVYSCVRMCLYLYIYIHTYIYVHISLHIQTSGHMRT